MRADIHYGQEHQSSTHGPDTDVQDQSLRRSHRACNTRPVHTDRFYTNVHAVAELSDGQLYVVSTFVKASGGCSAPMAKNPEEAKTNLGQMRFRQFSRRYADSAGPE